MEEHVFNSLLLSEVPAAVFADGMAHFNAFCSAVVTLPRVFSADISRRRLKRLYTRAHRIVRRDAKRALGRHDRIAIQLRGAS